MAGAFLVKSALGFLSRALKQTGRSLRYTRCCLSVRLRLCGFGPVLSGQSCWHRPFDLVFVTVVLVLKPAGHSRQAPRQLAVLNRAYTVGPAPRPSTVCGTWTVRVVACFEGRVVLAGRKHGPR